METKCCGTCRWVACDDWSENPELTCCHGDSMYFQYCVETNDMCPEWEERT